MEKEIKQIKDLTLWFEKNHIKEKRVCFIVYKKHFCPLVPSHNQQLKIAICYGWIDTKVKRINDISFYRWFVKRNSKSKWSKNTEKYANELIKNGKMKELGIRKYKEWLLKK